MFQMRQKKGIKSSKVLFFSTFGICRVLASVTGADCVLCIPSVPEELAEKGMAFQ